MNVPKTQITRPCQSEDLWNKALQTLDDENKKRINIHRPDKLAILEEDLAAAEVKKQLSIDKSWRYKNRKGQDIIIRDVMEKVVHWVNTLKAIAVNDCETFGAMAEGIEVVSYLIQRCAIFEILYLQGTTQAENNLAPSIVAFYAFILTYLSKAKAYYQQPAASRMIRVSCKLQMRKSADTSRKSPGHSQRLKNALKT
ncbi:MAG: hypothetical protein M1816_007493 [Peltula sp. TS41687]|nr:MAG: hypothetical protein M1816_007493 [Peltula sp. TS41687]